MKICCIYKITSPTGKIYIGQSRDFNQRLKKYKSCHCEKQPKLYSSLIKYGYDNHKVEIIKECTQDELNELEIFYIKEFDSFDTENGLNLSYGGHCRILSKESLAKIKASTKKHVAENGNYCKGKKASIESREKMSKSRNDYIAKHGNYKIIHTEETKKKMSISAKNRPSYSDERRKKISIRSSKPVSQIHIDSGDVIKEWDSLKDVVRSFGIKNYTPLRDSCNGIRNTPYKGFYWQFKQKNL